MARGLIRGAALLLAGVGLGAAGASVAAERRSESPYAALDLFARVITQIRDSYVDPVPQEKLVYQALDGLDNALDAHSVFLAPEAFRRLREEAEGQYVGIGAQTREDPRGLRILEVLRDGPAARAGILPGDLVTTVDGRPLTGLRVEEADALVRGREGEAVTLGIERDGVARVVPLLRTRVQESTVESEVLPGGAAYVRVRQFREGTSDAIAAQLAGLGGASLPGVLLDLRANPGGRLDEAVATVDLFVRAGRIVSTRGRRPGSDEVREAHDEKSDLDVPLVVLVDGQSASAAEIVAGALSDLRRATLVGERTYGKGSVQSLFEYEDGSALKLTIARYYLPSGRTIQDHVGLQPDLVVGPPTGEGPVERLRRSLEQAPGLPASERTALLEVVDQLPNEAPASQIDFSGPLTERLSRDPQLIAAAGALKRR